MRLHDTHSTPANHVLELTFQSNKIYPNPFFNVYLDAIFTSPDNRKIVVPAFWAGGNNWKVRYASNVIGIHRYITQCSDDKNSALHEVQGKIRVIPYAGENNLLQHGAPIVAEDNRHLSHSDHQPFFWLGDTWWMALSKRLSWADFKLLAQDRQEKGFTIIQLVAGLFPDMAAFDERGESHAGFPWTKDFTTINPSFFDAADQRILHLVSLGLAPCIVGSWGYYLQWAGVEKMKLHWRYIMARWGALPVIWVAAGEQTMPWYLSEQKRQERSWLKQGWSEIIRYMHQINAFERLITTHPMTSARHSVTEPSLLDFEMQQTDHAAPTASQAAMATAGWQSSPVMPVVNGESRYEALDIKPTVSATDVRQAFWAHMLNSGCAGHTYGANGIWQVNLKQAPFGTSPNGHDWGAISWDKSMHLPGASQVAMAKRFLLLLPWHQLTPLPNQGMQITTSKTKAIIANSLARFKRHQVPIAAASATGKLIIYYFLEDKPIQVELTNNMLAKNACWFDPTNGETKAVNGEITDTNIFQSESPGLNAALETDWVLVLSATRIDTHLDAL